MQQDSGGSPLVLIIEDDRALSNMYAHKFSLGGYRTIVAYDGKSGLEMAKKEKPNLVLLDMLLPEMKGEKVAKKIHSDKDLKETPVIILSNLADTKTYENSRDSGVKAYLLKPMYSPDQVLQVAQKYLSPKH